MIQRELFIKKRIKCWKENKQDVYTWDNEHVKEKSLLNNENIIWINKVNLNHIVWLKMLHTRILQDTINLYEKKSLQITQSQ